MALIVREEKPRKKHGCLWTIIVCVALYLILCGIMGAMMGNMFTTPETKLEANTIYRLDLDGTLVEQAPEENPLAGLLSELPAQYQQETVVGLDEVLSNIALAKSNDKVLGIYLKGGSMSMGPASAKAIRDALADFKQSGKFVIAYADSYGTLNYYVASVADKICLNTVGTIKWDGLATQKMYYTRLLEKIGVSVEILKVGEFKSAVEPFFMTHMSDADRKQTELYLQGVWGEIKQAVGSSRGLSNETLDAAADECMSWAAQSRYLDYGLADTLVYIQDMDTILRTYAGTKDYHLLSNSKMASVKRASVDAKDKVAVLYAEGEIFDGSGDGITDTEMIKQAKKILKDDAVKAVVLRVNSPGGSADASEQIWHAMCTLKQKGLPVVVSMGDYAASGGYYISCEADYIFAEPTTLTGSIGIFGMVPNLSKIRERAGLDVDGVGTNSYSLMESSMALCGMKPEEKAMMQHMVERGYDLFTGRCAEGRHMTQDAIKAIGEGRVWLGQDAVKIGLVDSLGNITDAIQKAASMASLGAYEISYFPEKTDPLEEMLSLLEPNTTDEEKLIARLRTLVSKPRILALMPEVHIQ